MRTCKSVCEGIHSTGAAARCAVNISASTTGTAAAGTAATNVPASTTPSFASVMKYGHVSSVGESGHLLP